MKKYLTLVIALVLVSVMSVHELAINFDISPFENNANYEVEFDEMDDTGEITLVEGGSFFGTGEEGDEGFIVGSVNIKIVEDLPPVLRVQMGYIGEDWIFTNKVIIKPADTRYTFEVDRDTDVSDGKIYEMFTLAMTDESIQMLQDIVDNDVILVKCRLDGSDRDLDCNLLFDREKLGQLLIDYKASGALDNSFALIKDMYPCTIK